MTPHTAIPIRPIVVCQAETSFIGFSLADAEAHSGTLDHSR